MDKRKSMMHCRRPQCCAHEFRDDGQWQCNTATRATARQRWWVALRCLQGWWATLLGNDGGWRCKKKISFYSTASKVFNCLLCAREKERKKKARKRKRKSFQTCSRIRHNPSGITLPSSFDLGTVGWQRCNNTSSLQ